MLLISRRSISSLTDGRISSRCPSFVSTSSHHTTPIGSYGVKCAWRRVSCLRHAVVAMTCRIWCLHTVSTYHSLSTLRLTTCALTSLCGVVARIPTTLCYACAYTTLRLTARVVLSAPDGAFHASGMMFLADDKSSTPLSTITCLHFDWRQTAFQY